MSNKYFYLLQLIHTTEWSHNFQISLGSNFFHLATQNPKDTLCWINVELAVILSVADCTSGPHYSQNINKPNIYAVHQTIQKTEMWI